jgi:hypothetical protein
MRKFFILAIAGCIGLVTLAQQRATLPENLKDLAVKKTVYFGEAHPNQNFENPALKSQLTPIETEIGDSWYDRQTNATMQNRLYYYEDGTIGAAWMHGYNQPGFDDRGTGYVFYDGMQWGDPPFTRIESQRCGWPNYWPVRPMKVCLSTGVQKKEPATGWNTSMKPLRAQMASASLIASLQGSTTTPSICFP